MSSTSESRVLLKMARDERDPAKWAEVYAPVLKAAEKDGDADVMVFALAQLARAKSIGGDLVTGRELLSRAATLANPRSTESWVRFLIVRGIFEREEGRSSLALATFSEAYAFASKSEQHRAAIDAAHHAALVGDTQNQIVWSLKAIAEAEAGHINEWLGPLWNNLGNTYDERGEFERALDAYTRSNEWHRRNGTGDMVISAIA